MNERLDKAIKPEAPAECDECARPSDARLCNDCDAAPIPDLPARCSRGHRAYVGLEWVECPTCDAIAEVEEDDDPGSRDGIMEIGLKRGDFDRVEDAYMVLDIGRCLSWEHPTLDGAIALWRADEIARLDEEGRR